MLSRTYASGYIDYVPARHPRLQTGFELSVRVTSAINLTGFFLCFSFLPCFFVFSFFFFFFFEGFFVATLGWESPSHLLPASTIVAHPRYVSLPLSLIIISFHFSFFARVGLFGFSRDQRDVSSEKYTIHHWSRARVN